MGEEAAVWLRTTENSELTQEEVRDWRKNKVCAQTNYVSLLTFKHNKINIIVDLHCNLWEKQMYTMKFYEFIT